MHIYVLGSGLATAPNGHHLPVIRHLIAAFTHSKVTSTLLSDDAGFKAFALDCDRSKVSPDVSYLNFMHVDADQGAALRMVVDECRARYSKGIQDLSIVFFPWWADVDTDTLSWFEEEFLEYGIRWSTIANVSRLLRWSSHDPEEVGFLAEASQSRTLRKLFAWDPRAGEMSTEFPSSTVTSLPEFHDSDMSIALPKPKEEVIGFFGGLSGWRGLTTFILLALLNPRLKFVAKGYGSGRQTLLPRVRWQSARLIPLENRCRRDLSVLIWKLAGFLPNLTITENYFQSQRHLNDEIGGVTAVFVAGHLQPYSSGIALQALACGSPVLWTPGDSAIADSLSIGYPAGRLSFIERVQPLGLRRTLVRVRTAPHPSEIYSFEDFRSSLMDALC